MERAKDVVGIFLIFAGVSGFLGGIRGLVGEAWWGGPALGVGAVANVLAYRVLRPTASKRADDPGADDPGADAPAADEPPNA